MTQQPNHGALVSFFLLRPTFGILLVFLFCLSGLLAYQTIVKESAPDLAIPQATVETEWPGADPETIEQLVTDKIESKVKTLKGLKRMRSASFNSYSVIAVEFRAEANIQDAMMRLREKVRDAEPDLPKAIKKPRIQQVSVDDTPILTLALFGAIDPVLVTHAAERLKKRLEKVAGVNKIEFNGRRNEVIHVLLLPDRLAALGISPTLVQTRIEESNLDMPWDRIESEAIGATMRLYGRYRTVEDLRALPVTRLETGRIVRLGEIAQVRRELEREKVRVALSWHGEPFRPAVDVSITKMPGTDTLKVIAEVRTVLERFTKSSQWPQGLDYRITFDQTDIVWQDLSNVFSNGLQAMAAVFVVLLIMLTWREALVAGFAIPITFLGTLAVIWGLGYTLNQMVIIGMVLALGLLVDVFILMMEGMHDAIYVRGMRFSEAALDTVKTYAMPAASGQMTTILAMAPLMAISGVDGKFIRIIPVTTIICLVLSYIVALLVAVPLSRFVLSQTEGGGHSKTRMDRITERATERLTRWSLRNTVRSRSHAALWVLATLLLFVLSLVAAGMLPSLLYPKADGRKLGITVELAPDATLDQAQTVADDVGKVLRAQPYLESLVKFTGMKSPLARNSIGEALMPYKDYHLVGFSCIFTPKDTRERLGYQYLGELREKLNKVLRRHPGTQLTFTMEVGGSTTEDPIQIHVMGEEMDRLRQISIELQSALAAIPGAGDVRDNLGPARPDVKFSPRREVLDFYGIRQNELAMQLRYIMTEDEVAKFDRPEGEDIEIRLGTLWPSRGGLAGGPTRMEELLTIQAIRPNGMTVPAAALFDVELGEAPLSITHYEGNRAVTILGKTENRTTEEILTDLDSNLQGMQSQWPESYYYQFGGEMEAAAETFGSAGQMLLVAIILVFALLVLQFGSFSQPFIIMFSIPFALIGTFFGFVATWTPFSFTAMVGVISLVGIVVNDAIVMIETMNTRRRQGLPLKEAAAQGAADRLRPIVTTSVTTVVGLVPLALSDPMWMPLCTAIIYGLIVATFVSQLIIPSMYLLLTRQGAVG